MLTFGNRDDILPCMASAPTVITEADILSHVIAPDQPTLPVASAQSILALRFNKQAIDRMNELAEKNRHNLLSENEQGELEKYQCVGNFLNLMQAKARLSLQQISNGS
jgi:uncharacterized protein YnzC (UPF0291/DUF896 family)